MAICMCLHRHALQHYMHTTRSKPVPFSYRTPEALATSRAHSQHQRQRQHPGAPEESQCGPFPLPSAEVACVPAQASMIVGVTA